MKQHLPRLTVLNQKEIWMELDKGVIIQSKPMNQNKIFMSGSYMQDVIKDKITTGSGDNGFTNMSNVHTFAICCMDLIGASIVRPSRSPVI
jgi:hypothetical protein